MNVNYEINFINVLGLQTSVILITFKTEHKNIIRFKSQL